MKRYLEIDHCEDCKYRMPTGNKWLCTHPMIGARLLPIELPSWCPLPKVEEPKA
jgi:hypothetical protein